MRLKDQTILVTGSTQGIGEALARRFVDEGARVVLHGRDQARGAKLRDELGADRAAFVAADLVAPEEPARLGREALAAFGCLDAVVNNAAITTRAKLHDTDVAFFDQLFAANVRAPLMLFRELLPALKQSRGRVLNIGSVLAYTGQSNLLAYSMSKGAMMVMTRNLADTFGPEGVRVNQINVGWTLTDNEYRTKIEDGLPPDWPERLPPSIAPSGGILRPEHVAEAALYWVSPESAPVSGSVVEIEQYPIIGRYPDQEGDDNDLV